MKERRTGLFLVDRRPFYTPREWSNALDLLYYALGEIEDNGPLDRETVRKAADKAGRKLTNPSKRQ